MKKKYILIGITALLCVILTACAAKDTNESTTASVAASENTVVTTAAATTEEAKTTGTTEPSSKSDTTAKTEQATQKTTKASTASEDAIPISVNQALDVLDGFYGTDFKINATVKENGFQYFAVYDKNGNRYAEVKVNLATSDAVETILKTGETNEFNLSV